MVTPSPVAGMNARTSLCLTISILWLAWGGCERTCDPDSIFHEEVADGAAWLECGDIQIDDDRDDVAQCLRDLVVDSAPGYVRVTSDDGVSYVFVDGEARVGILTWAGNLDCVGDNVKKYSNCPTTEVIDAFEQPPVCGGEAGP